MLKVSKKITNAIAREYNTSDFTIVKRIYIHSVFKQLCVDLVMFRIGKEKTTNMLRYFGDNSYSITRNYHNEKEIIEELKYQIDIFY